MQQRPTTASTESRQIAEQITRLMSHYWTADDDAVMRRAQVEDWLDDLVEFGAHSVADACQEWRRSSTKRPTPADIRKLCQERRRVGDMSAALLEPPKPIDDRDAIVIADTWAQRRGYAGIADFQAQSFIGVSIKTRGGWITYPGLRQIGS